MVATLPRFCLGGHLEGKLAGFAGHGDTVIQTQAHDVQLAQVEKAAESPEQRLGAHVVPNYVEDATHRNRGTGVSNADGEGRDKSGGEEEGQKYGAKLHVVLVGPLRTHVGCDLLLCQLERLDLGIAWVERRGFDARHHALPGDVAAGGIGGVGDAQERSTSRGGVAQGGVKGGCKIERHGITAKTNSSHHANTKLATDAGRE